MANEHKFWPIRGTEEQILKQPYFDGKIYFAYDTNKIYLDVDGSKHPMGSGSSGILYAEANEDTLTKETPEDEADDKYFMSIEALEEKSRSKKVLADDLILNADGRFFRILSVDDANQQIYCQLLAVSGTGGGGGGGATYSNRSKIYKKDPASNYLINGRAASIEVYAVSGRDPEDGSQLDEKLIVHWALSEKTSTGLWSEYKSETFPIDASTTEDPIWKSFEFGTKARQSTTNRLTMWVTGSASTESRSFEYEFYTSELRLEKHPNFSNVNTYSSNGVNIYCTTVGDLEKAIYYYFETDDGEVLLNPGGTIVGAGTSEQSFTVPAEYATHGSHKVRIALYQSINGETDFNASAEPIEMEIAVVEVGNEKPIIWLGDYKDEYYQYDNIRIPFRVYDPSAVIGTEITLYKDSDKIGNRTITDNTVFSTWEIIDGDLNMRNYYYISCGKDDLETRREITFMVSEDPTRADMKIAQAGLRYSFDASGRSNSESATNRATVVYGEGENAVRAKLDGFNWYNNGWVTDSATGNTCLRISNGAVFSIPLKQTVFATSSASEQSHTFEFQFKVRNVQDYSSIVHNVTRYQGNTEEQHPPTYPNWTDENAYNVYTHPELYLEWSNGKEFDNYDAFLQWYLPAYAERHPETIATIPPSYDNLEYRKTDKILSTNYAAGRYFDGQHGICIGAQDALFTNGVDTVNVSYVEDKLVNLSIVYSHGSGDEGGSNKLMSIYLNGMLTGVARSTVDGSWTIGNDDTINIIFDSRYCDFDLFKIRIYNQPLTLPVILTNYMVDLKDPVGYDLTRIAAVNNTIGESQLNFNDMITYNENHPDGYIMPYLIITTNPKHDNKLPWSKSVKLEDYATFEFVNTGLERAYNTGELGQLAERAGQTVEEYYKHHCPSWTGDNITIQIQGTSSEFYPRRNYKAKTKDSSKKVNMYMNRGPFVQTYADPETKEQTHLDFFYMDNNTVGTTKFTLKIDYMESSGTYNMGFANIVKNAYTHHPLYDYYQKGAIMKADTEYKVSTEYKEGTTYWYKNHKGNMKNTVDDELKIQTAEDYAMGPVAFAQSIGQTKVLTDPAVEGYNTWYEATTVYSTAPTPDYLDDYRTSVQGFPVLTFHRKTDANGNVTGISYIGRYNMLLDKGSDEAFGFKPIDEVYQKFVTKKNKPVKVSKVAECWEAENNSRGFCSFRDASTNRTDDKFFDTGTLTVHGAPIVADYWEYRYHDCADSLDILYELDANISDEDSIATVADELGVDIQDSTVIPSPDSNYKGTYTQGMKNAGDALLRTYSNWERAVRWVYSTDQDAVPSMGVYSKVDLGLEAYAPNLYYILNSDSEYELDTSETYDPLLTYYKASGEEYTPIKLCADSSLIYQPNTYYIPSALKEGEYVLDPETAFNPNYTYYNLTANEAESGATILPEPVTYNGHVYTYDTKEYRNAKFTNDLSKHFNLEYLVTYFVMTEVFECYDSRGKNAMFASWGPQEEGGDYIWYPLFYDIDTQLGINNTGIPSFEYYVDATENGTFSTNDSLLWNNLYKNFRGLIIQKYRQLRGTNSTYQSLKYAPLQTVDRIESWYLADPEATGSIVMRGEKPLIALNLDEYYKYITITNPLMGYQDRNGGTGIDNGTYFYALQGDRSLSRQQFLINRFNYIDSWLNQGNYERGGTNIIRGRIAANSPSNTSDKWIEGETINTEPTLNTNVPYWKDAAETQKTHLFDGEYWINMEPVRNSYVTVGTDTANFPSLKYTNLDGPVKFVTPDLENGVRKSGGYHEQLYYIYGLDQMKSLGDMSRLYWTEFNIEGSATKMTDLLLGYDGLDEEGNFYLNDRINMYGIHASSSASDKGGMPLLKRVNLSYVRFNDEAPTYNFTSCEKLEDFRAIGSNITNVSFANGVALNTLYLPETIKRLDLTEATKLNNIVTQYIPRNDAAGIDVTRGLYIPNLTDKADNEATSQIETISLIGDCLGYDSYKLLRKYYNARMGAAMSYITMTDVRWTPYKQLDEGTPYNVDDNNAHLYWVDDGHFGLKEYVHENYDTWTLLIKNGELYRLNTQLDGSTIKSTDLLMQLKNASNFRSAAATSTPVPVITGIIYVDNDTPINERDIEANLVSAYPDLKFFFKQVEQVPAAKYIILNDDGTYDTLVRRTLAANETFFPNPLTLVSSRELDRYETRLKYDFYGWGTVPLSPSGVENLRDDNWFKEEKGNLVVTTDNPESPALTSDMWYNNWDSLSIQEGVNDYVFYAVFGVHKYIMTFKNGDNTTDAGILKIEAESPVPYPKTIVPSKSEKDLPFDQTYYFTGVWRLENGTELKDGVFKSQRNLTFYPEFATRDVHSAPTNLDYFEFKTYEYLDGSPNFSTNFAIPQYVSGSTYNVSGVSIGIKPGVTLSGKVTLPTYDPDGRPVVAFDASWSIPGLPQKPLPKDCVGGQNITHIFWYHTDGKDPMLRIIPEYTFAGSTDDKMNLQYFEFPSSLRVVNHYAFYRAQSLTDINLRNANNLLWIGNNAFRLSTGSTEEEILNMGDIYIPSSVASIGAQAFAAINGNYGTVQFGTAPTGSRLCRLGELDFTAQDVTVTIFSSIGNLGVFRFYASSTAQKNAMMKFVNDTGDTFQTFSMFEKAGTKEYLDAGNLSS